MHNNGELEKAILKLRTIDRDTIDKAVVTMFVLLLLFQQHDGAAVVSLREAGDLHAQSSSPSVMN